MGTPNVFNFSQKLLFFLIMRYYLLLFGFSAAVAQFSDLFAKSETSDKFNFRSKQMRKLITSMSTDDEDWLSSADGPIIPEVISPTSTTTTASMTRKDSAKPN